MSSPNVNFCIRSSADQAAFGDAAGGLEQQLEKKLADGSLAGQDATFAKQTIGVVSSIRDAVNAEVAKRNGPSAGPSEEEVAADQRRFLVAACNQWKGEVQKLTGAGFTSNSVGDLKDIGQRYCYENGPMYLKELSDADSKKFYGAVQGLQTELKEKLGGSTAATQVVNDLQKAGSNQ